MKVGPLKLRRAFHSSKSATKLPSNRRASATKRCSVHVKLSAANNHPSGLSLKVKLLGQFSMSSVAYLVAQAQGKTFNLPTSVTDFNYECNDARKLPKSTFRRLVGRQPMITSIHRQSFARDKAQKKNTDEYCQFHSTEKKEVKLINQKISARLRRWVPFLRFAKLFSFFS